MKTTKRKYFVGTKKLKNVKMFEQFVAEFESNDEEPFLASTAKDYDMPLEVVKELHKKHKDDGDFYAALEAYIRDRANR